VWVILTDLTDSDSIDAIYTLRGAPGLAPTQIEIVLAGDPAHTLEPLLSGTSDRRIQDLEYLIDEACGVCTELGVRPGQPMLVYRNADNQLHTYTLDYDIPRLLDDLKSARR
jgi:hypothetical protein